MEKKHEAFDYEALRKNTIEQLRSGTPLFGKGGALAPMLKEFLETALDAEIETHLDVEQRGQGNRKNGYGKKILKTSEYSFELATPRDRDGEFEPQTVRKRETILAKNLEKKIIGMYGLGMSFRDISSHIKELGVSLKKHAKNLK